MTTIYVSKLGLDANPGTDPAAPKLTITAALGAIPSFDGVEHLVEILDSGTYAETNVSLKGSGGWAKWVTVRGATGQLPTIDGAGTVAVPAFLCSNFQTPAAGQYQKVHRVRFTAFNGSGSGKGVIASGVALEVADVVFDTCGGPGVNYVNGTALTPAKILRSIARDGGPLVFQGAGTDYVHVENCLVHGTSSAKIATVGVNSHVYFSTVYNANPAASIKGIESYTVRNCVSVRGGGAEVGTTGITATAGGTVAYSCSYGWNTAYSGTQGASCLTDDPLFTDAAADDFTLQAASPAINAGTDVGVTDDIIGTPRPNGAGYDLGAYEMVLSTTVVSATPISPTSVRVTLADAWATGPTWTDPANYTIAQNAPALGVAPVVLAATPTGNPASEIVLTTGEHTQGQGYRVSLVGVAGVADGFADYAGQGDAPSAALTVLGPTSVRLDFDEGMYNGDGSLELEANYVFTPALAVSNAAPEAVAAPTYVILTTAAPVGGGAYTLTTTNLRDAALNALSPASYALTAAGTSLSGATASDLRTAVGTFTQAPDEGVAAASDWTVTTTDPTAAAVEVTSVSVDGVTATITVHPAMTPGAAYTLTAVNASRDGVPGT